MTTIPFYRTPAVWTECDVSVRASYILVRIAGVWHIREVPLSSMLGIEAIGSFQYSDGVLRVMENGRSHVLISRSESDSWFHIL